jgi:hypothetical protein
MVFLGHILTVKEELKVNASRVKLVFPLITMMIHLKYTKRDYLDLNTFFLNGSKESTKKENSFVRFVKMFLLDWYQTTEKR